jgi:hypothetical protein
MGCTACTEPQCLYKGDLYLYFTYKPCRLISFDGVSLKNSGPGSVVGIATSYGLDGPEIESRWGAKFSAPVQTDPASNSASCAMGTGSFAGVKSGRGVTLTPHPLLVPWSRKDRAILLFPLWAVQPVQKLSACTRVTFTFTLPISHVDISFDGVSLKNSVLPSLLGFLVETFVTLHTYPKNSGI